MIAAPLERAQAQAAEVRARNFPPPCQCAECVMNKNLPAIQRILSNWTPIERAMK